MMYGSPASSAAPQPSPTDGNKNLWVPPYPALFFDHQRLFHKYYDVWATELMKRRTQYGQNLRKNSWLYHQSPGPSGGSFYSSVPTRTMFLAVGDDLLQIWYSSSTNCGHKAAMASLK